MQILAWSSLPVWNLSSLRISRTSVGKDSEKKGPDGSRIWKLLWNLSEILDKVILFFFDSASYSDG